MKNFKGSFKNPILSKQNIEKIDDPQDYAFNITH